MVIVSDDLQDRYFTWEKSDDREICNGCDPWRSHCSNIRSNFTSSIKTFIAVVTCIRTNQKPKEVGGAPRRQPLWVFMYSYTLDQSKSGFALKHKESWHKVPTLFMFDVKRI